MYFNLSRNKEIKHTKMIFESTASGKGFKKNPVSVEIEFIDESSYRNFVDSVSFFNNWGNGASCRAYYNYSSCGYHPYRITTISPFRTEKHIDLFEIIEKR